MNENIDLEILYRQEQGRRSRGAVRRERKVGAGGDGMAAS
jgi:hypothetical protein